MLELKIDEITDIKALALKTIFDDEAIKIKTDKGNAILINEREWNILVDGFKLLINGTTAKQHL